MDEPTPKQVIERHRGRLLRVEGVVGIAVGISQADSARSCIVVYADLDEWPDDLPHEIEGCPVEVHRTSGFEARGDQEH